MLGIDIKPSTSVRNLGVIIDQDLSLKEQVNAICRSCYGHLRSIIQIRPYLTKSAAHTIVQSLISSRLDYCNSLLAELPQYLIHKLQKVHGRHRFGMVMKSGHFLPLAIISCLFELTAQITNSTSITSLKYAIISHWYCTFVIICDSL